MMLIKSCGWKALGFEERDLQYLCTFIYLMLLSWYNLTGLSKLSLWLFTADRDDSAKRSQGYCGLHLLSFNSYRVSSVISFILSCCILIDSTRPAPVFVQPFLQREVSWAGEKNLCMHVSAVQRHSSWRWFRGELEQQSQQYPHLMIFIFFGTAFQNTVLLLCLNASHPVWISQVLGKVESKLLILSVVTAVKVTVRAAGYLQMDSLLLYLLPWFTQGRCTSRDDGVRGQATKLLHLMYNRYQCPPK